MKDRGDRYEREVCDVCHAPFDPKRIIPVPPICRTCREDAEAAMVPQ